jgi:pimeloyl-ACP methyl ester carboxylesterase
MRMPWIAATAAGALIGGLALYSGAAARRAEAAVPRDGELIEVNGDRTHYVDKGAGPAIVMIHGLAGQMRNFATSLVEELAADHRVILVDRPGSGYSVRGAGKSASLTAQAETIAAFIRALGLERPLLVGHSLGGALALTIAVEHPDVVGGLALIAPLTQVVEEPPPVFRALAIESPLLRGLVAWTLAVPLGTLNADKVLHEIFAPDPVPVGFPVAGGGMLGMRPAAFYANSSDMVAINDDLPGVVARYSDLRVPVSILYGRGDNLLDCRLHGEQTAGEIEGAEIELIEGGHMLPFTAPDVTSAFIRRAAERVQHGGAARG